MKKYISVIVLGFMLAAAFNQAQGAATWTSSECNADKGGEIVEVGGDSFCKSTSTMNWWSAYSWCQAMGGRMPSIAELCPGKTITRGNSCGRTYPTYVWSSSQSDVSQRMWIAEKTTMQREGSSDRTSKNPAYCLKN